MRKSQTNNTDINNTELNHIYLSIDQEGMGEKLKAKGDTNLLDGTRHGTDERSMMDEIDRENQIGRFRQKIKQNVSYDILVHDYPYDSQRLDGFVELMAETCCSTRKTIRINQEDMPIENVRSRFLKLDSEHIRYVMDCLDNNTTAVGNIRAYLLSALYNAPVTISQYYASLVRHDMAGKGRGS